MTKATLMSKAEESGLADKPIFNEHAGWGGAGEVAGGGGEGGRAPKHSWGEWGGHRWWVGGEGGV